MSFIRGLSAVVGRLGRSLVGSGTRGALAADTPRAQLLEAMESRVMMTTTVGAPDLRVTSMVGVPALIARGQEIAARAVVVNTGTAVSQPTQVQVVLSKDKVLGNFDDRVLGVLNVGETKVRGSLVVNGSLEVADNVDAGVYFVFAKVDPNGVQTETNESNNVLLAGRTTLAKSTFSVRATAVNIREEGGKSSFIITRTGGSTKIDQSFFYDMSPSTANFGDDYTLQVNGEDIEASGELTIPAGKNSITVNVVSKSDAIAESKEAITFHLSDVGYANLNTKAYTASINIIDDEPVISIVGGPTSIREKNGIATFVIKRTGGNNKTEQVVNLGIITPEAHGAVRGVDYVLTTAGGKSTITGDTITFSPGQTSAVIQVRTINDELAEGHEKFTLRLLPDVPLNGYLVSEKQAQVVMTILDNAPILKITANKAQVVESLTNKLTFEVFQSNGTTSFPAHFTASIQGTGEDEAATVISSGTVTIRPGRNLIHVSLEGVEFGAGDHVVNLSLSAIEGGKAFSLLPGYEIGSTVVIDETPHVGISKIDNVAVENSDNLAYVRVTRSGLGQDKSLTIGFTAEQGTTNGALPVDYSLSSSPSGAISVTAHPTSYSGSITFAPGQSYVDIYFTGTGDKSLGEGRENITFKLSPTTGVTLEPGHSETIISVDDGTVPVPDPGLPVDIGYNGSVWNFTAEGTPSKLFSVDGYSRTVNFLNAEETRQGYGSMKWFLSGTPEEVKTLEFELGTKTMSNTGGEVINLTLLFTGVRPESLLGKQIQFFSPGTTGTDGTFTATSNIASPRTINGTFKLVDAPTVE